MPYIKKKNRHDYLSVVEGVLGKIPLADPMLQAEYVGYFIAGLVRAFDAPEDVYSRASNPFYAFCEDEEPIAQIESEIAVAIELLHSKSLQDRAGDLNYLISAVVWGFLGDSKLFEQARYYTRAYMHGILLRIRDEIDNFSGTMGRSRILLRGVFEDVIIETYRRKTSAYEDYKMNENGDIWPLRVDSVILEAKGCISPENN